MYPFMVKHLGLDSKGIVDPKTGVFVEAHPLRKHALKPGSAVSF